MFTRRPGPPTRRSPGYSALSKKSPYPGELPRECSAGPTPRGERFRTVDGSLISRDASPARLGCDPTFPACTLGPGRAPRPVLSLNATESMQGHQCPARSLAGIHFRTDPRPPISTVPPHCGPQKSFLHLEIHQRLHRPIGRDCFAGRRQPRQRHWHSCGSGVVNNRGGSLGQKLGRQAVRGATTVRWSLTSPCTFRPMRC